MKDRRRKTVAQSYFSPLLVGPGMLRETWELRDTSDEQIMILRNVHTMNNCSGRPCIIHAPSNHTMVDWPLNPRGELIERLCIHGVGHPDPDSLRFLTTVTGDDGWGVHGCDGCCSQTRHRPIKYNPPAHRRWWDEPAAVVDDDF